MDTGVRWCKMSNPSPYTMVELGYADHPALQPEVVIARIKQVYEKTLIGRQLLGAEPVQGDSVSWIEEGDIVGNVDWITEEGGFPQLDFKYSKKAKPIRPYGAYFDVTLMERKWARINTISRKINRAVYKMRRFEDDLIFYEILNATGIQTFDGTNWTDPTAGDPLADLEHAKRLIRDATEGMEPTDVIMSSAMYERLTKFDFVRNNNYLQARVVETGKVPAIAGLNIVIDNAVDPNDDGQVVVLRRKDIGYIAEAIPINTIPVDGKTLGNPMLDNRYFNFAMGEPVIDSPELICVITGLKA
ncbi:hypothetical protein DRP05_13700 [Archaeoglobales archaeon]|nr:MAG: hypothetical protein DRP05_13700 [Archaeoglobales archaeon]